VGKQSLEDGAKVQPSQPFAPNRRSFATDLLRAAGHQAELLTVREVAEILRLSTATVYKLCDRGALPHLRIANALRFLPDEIMAFLAKRTNRR
jgi:excisionase family DNA binding protein